MYQEDYMQTARLGLCSSSALICLLLPGQDESTALLGTPGRYRPERAEESCWPGASYLNSSEFFSTLFVKTFSNNVKIEEKIESRRQPLAKRPV